MFDLADGTPLGSTAIAMTIAGVVAGLLALIAADPQWWLDALFTGLGAAAGALMSRSCGSSSASPSRSRIGSRVVVPVVAISAAVMSPVLVPLARWCLRIKRPEWTQPVGGDARRA